MGRSGASTSARPDDYNMTQLKLIQARYGPIEYGQWVDVKPILEKLNGVQVVVSDITFTADEQWGDKKRILKTVSQREDGSTFEVELEQGETFNLNAIHARPTNWEEILYATRKPRILVAAGADDTGVSAGAGGDGGIGLEVSGAALIIHEADYGVPPEQWIDVRERLQSLVKDNSLDIIVNNSTLTPDSNPFRGKRKTLKVVYSIDGGERIERRVEEKDWLIIGPVRDSNVPATVEGSSDGVRLLIEPDTRTTEQRFKDAGVVIEPYEKQMTPTALNDYLIRRFSISPQRLRGPMPIELRDFHRNDLAQLFAELGFKRGAEIGVAEGNYSEILMKANPTMELLCVDPWHSYSDNPQNKTKERNEHAYNEAKRKLCQPDWRVKLIPLYSMEAVRDVADDSLDFVYIDGHHSYPYVMCDIIEWTKRVRSGGIVALDDIYKLNEKWGAGPMEAIYDYTRAMRINPWWLIAAHKSVDAFFVKP